MFFVLSKTLGLLALPTNFMIALGLVGAILMLTRFAVLGRRLVVSAMLLLAIVGLTPLGSLMLYPLESRFPKWDPANGAPDGIIVLGGPVDSDLSVMYGMPVTVAGADRVIQAAALARRYPNARILFTGGSANLIATEAKEADVGAEILLSLGVPKERLLLERQSRNTYENAIFSKAMISPKPGERWLLVTSAYHMPRSVGLFRKAGFPVEPYPVDWRVGRVLDFDGISLLGLRRADIAVREWVGLVAYRLRGRIDDLFPGPA
ncbi:MULTISPECIES: YdcF family protein [unclassified Bradyrhizobium]|uniref:YdcF family protein n=1 Tax=unclassified Bradyrhizobium TaxID=2631580 RepID=UPI002916089E|nr:MULTISPECIES: YdcF family protein [unclassified Bradyrhizobium]